MFDSFDGAIHLDTIGEKIHLVSFSTALVNDNVMKEIDDNSTARSNLILTWMQCNAKEEQCVLLTVLCNHYESKKKLQLQMKMKGLHIDS